MPHIHKEIDFTVEVFVVHQRKVLLRKHDKCGIWLSIGGHIELNEDPNEAAVREVREETGLDVVLYDTRTFLRDEKGFKELIAPIAMNRHKISTTHEHVSLVYFAAAQTSEVTPEKETDQWKWCAEEEVPFLEGIQPDISFYAKRAIALVSGKLPA